MPWIETEVDEEFNEFITHFANERLPRIYELLQQYNDEKKIVILKSREEADEWLNRHKPPTAKP